MSQMGHKAVCIISVLTTFLFVSVFELIKNWTSQIYTETLKTMTYWTSFGICSTSFQILQSWMMKSILKHLQASTQKSCALFYTTNQASHNELMPAVSKSHEFRRSFVNRVWTREKSVKKWEKRQKLVKKIDTRFARAHRHPNHLLRRVRKWRWRRRSRKNRGQSRLTRDARTLRIGALFSPPLTFPLTTLEAVSGREHRALRRRHVARRSWKCGTIFASDWRRTRPMCQMVSGSNTTVVWNY